MIYQLISDAVMWLERYLGFLGIEGTTVFIALTTVVAGAALVLAYLGSRDVSAASAGRPASNPVDEAGRILAQRYASGEITSDEYMRMLSILRR